VALALSVYASYLLGPCVALQMVSEPTKLISPTEGSSGAPWKLYPEGNIPGELPNVTFNESYIHAEPWWACNSVHTSDPVFLNVSVPLLVPFLVDKSHPNWKDTVVVIAPGGSWQVLVWDKEGTDVARWLNTFGISAVVLKYRVPYRVWLNNTGGSLAANSDAQRAISMVRVKVVPLGFNGSRIGFMGFSAGGIIGLSVSSAPGRLYPHIDAIDDVSYRPDYQLLIYAAHWDIWGLDPMVTNDTAAKQEPPSFFAVAINDPCVKFDHALDDFLRLKNVGVKPTELHIYPNGGHAYGRCNQKYVKNRSAACDWTLQALTFIEHFIGDGVLLNHSLGKET